MVKAQAAGGDDAGDRADGERRGAATRTLGDKWTIVTLDGSMSAHFEHTVAVTADGPRVLTTLG
jgi:methionine aminopeptidase